MSYAIIQSLNHITNEISTITRILRESKIMEDDVVMESADGVLTQFYTTLKSGGNFTPQECEDFSQILTGLSILSIDDNRQSYNIDISTPEGQEKFLNVMDHVGENKSITGQVRRIARDEATSEYKKNLKKIEGFRQMKPSEQQDFIIQVNKLRVGYQRLRQMMSNGQFQQKRAELKQGAADRINPV